MVTVDTETGIAEFRFYRPRASEVYLAGDFNRWQPKQLRMTRSPSGYWVARMRLSPGTFRFRYHADGQWFADYAAFGIEQGPFGFNAVVRVTRQPQPLTIDLVEQRQEPIRTVA